jgi:hypothetical protein
MMYKLLVASLLAAPPAAVGQDRPAPQMEVFREIAEALANRDADAFLEQFDQRMSGYEKLRDEIRELLALTQEIGTTIDVITDAGDQQKRSLELDWVLKLDTEDPRREIVKCVAEKQGKKWKITALEPIDFFRK